MTPEETKVLEDALRAIIALPSEHDLLTNAIAKAMFFIAEEALERISAPLAVTGR
jgi:hypothetical protein